MSQDRLCDLALISIEWDKTEKTDFDDIIDEFSFKNKGTESATLISMLCYLNKKRLDIANISPVRFVLHLQD